MSQQQDNLCDVTDALEQILTPILVKLDGARQDSKDLLQLLKAGEFDVSREKIVAILELVSSIEEAQKPILEQLEHSYSVEMLDNIRDVLERMQQALNERSDLEKALFLCEFQLIPMLRTTRETFYFWGRVNKNPERLKRYYEEEFALSFHNPYVASGEELPYQASIVIVAYNKLSMTKRCVKSVLENTDFERLKAELILVDHGSNDGTLEYFESIPQARVVHFKHNTMAAMFPILPQICCSPFYVHVANDTIVTKDWLDILLTCIKSDPKIVTVSPATCNISNRQDLNVPTKNVEELVEIAKHHNKSNPLLWCDRARVYPPIGVFSLAVLNQIGFWDPAIYTFYNCDDDFCFRARRRGFRMVLCEDVFCYHEGHATLSDRLQNEPSLLSQARKLFKRKNGIYPYGIGLPFNFILISALQKEINVNQELQCKLKVEASGKDTNPLNILLLNGGVGDTALQARNILRRLGKQVDIYHIQETSEYEDDIKHYAAGYASVGQGEITQALQTNFPEVKFDFVLVEVPTNKDFISTGLAEKVASRLTDEGIFLFILKNDLYVQDMQQMIDFAVRKVPLKDWSSISFEDLCLLKSIIESYFNIQLSGINTANFNMREVELIIRNSYGEVGSQQYQTIFLSDYIFMCKKKKKNSSFKLFLDIGEC